MLSSSVGYDYKNSVKVTIYNNRKTGYSSHLALFHESWVLI